MSDGTAATARSSGTRGHCRLPGCPGTAGGLVTFGESMGLISTHEIGLIEFARDYRYSIGGAESNVAIGAARLGAPVTWIGRLGCDATGDMIERRLCAEGIRVHAVELPRKAVGTGHRRTCAAGAGRASQHPDGRPR